MEQQPPQQQYLAAADMSEAEAQAADLLIKEGINRTQFLLYEMRERKGWKALGFESFEQYGKESLGYERAHLNRIAAAGEIALRLGYDGLDPIGSNPKESHLRPLKSVPPEVQAEIWQAAQAKAAENNEKITAKRIDDAIAAWRARTEAAERQADHLAGELSELKAAPPALPEDYAVAIKALADAGGIEAINEKTAKVKAAAAEAREEKKTALKELEKVRAQNKVSMDLENSLNNLRPRLLEAMDIIHHAREGMLIHYDEGGGITQSAAWELQFLRNTTENLLNTIDVLISQHLEQVAEGSIAGQRAALEITAQHH